MDDARIERTARWVEEAHARSDRFVPVPETFRPVSSAEAYLAQQRLLARWMESGVARGFAGWKIGVTSPVIQCLVGLTEPCYGAILEGTVFSSGCAVRRSDFHHLQVECELGFRLGGALPIDRAPFTMMQVAEAVVTCAPAFELVDDRYSDYSVLDAQSLVADNCWAAGAVVGPPCNDWKSRDLARLRGRLFVNGREVGSGLTGDAYGNPLAALTWLVNTLASRGHALRPGSLVLTGSVISTRPLAPGDRATYVVEGLGSVELRVRD